jgi:Trk K+ transport system NAD-binding subunit
MNNLSLWIIIRRLRFPFLVIIVTFAISILGMVLIPGVDNDGNVYHLNFFDAFYFVSYMASTIGFGESPYDFTYPQKIWVSISLYVTVVGWFYGIGSIVALMQDKVLALELSRSSFVKSVRNIKEPFILISGYNNVTKPLISRLAKEYKRMVLVDKNQSTIDAFKLENYHPHIPSLSANLLDPNTLKMAGILLPNCKSAVIVFNNDHKNTTIAMKCQYLNKNVSLFVRSSSIQNSDFLYGLGLEHIENPFKIISNRLYLALCAPHLWLLELWVYGKSLELDKKHHIPRGKCIIYGYGRMGMALESGFKKADLPYTFIEAKLTKTDQKNDDTYGNEKIQKQLLNAGIKEASIIIAGTRDDMTNLAIIFLAKKLNPNIYTISRENEVTDITIFDSAKIDRNYILEDIVGNKIYNYIAMPLANKFIKILNTKNEKWGKELVEKITYKLGYNPYIFEMQLNKKQAYALSCELSENKKIILEVLKKSRSDFTKNNNLIFLMLIRDKKIHLLPEDSMEIALNDKLLIACKDKDSEVDLAYILNNIYELHYVLYGKEKISGVSKLFIKS